MRYILTILFVLLLHNAIAQPPRNVPFGATRVEDTSSTAANLKANGALRLPLYPNTDATKGLSTDAAGNVILRTFSGGGGSTDTTSLSNRINLKYNTADTLNKWQYKGSYELFTNKATSFGVINNILYPSVQAVNTQINIVAGLKVNYTDTPAMLAPYLRKSDTGSMLTSYLRKSDTSLMLGAYLRKYDTAQMLANYFRKSDSGLYSTWYFVDTAKKNIRAAIASGSADSSVFSTRYRNDTGNTAIRAYIATSQALDLKYTDSGAMLAPYIRKSDSAAMLLSYVRKSDTSNMLIPYLRKFDTTSMLAYYQRKGDSATYSTKYRNDTGNTAIRAQIAGIPTSADSSIFSTRWRNDTGNFNNRAYANALSALDLKYTDSAAMLLPYVRKSDTAAMLLTYLRKSDTSAMLASYIRKSDSAAFLASYLRKSDTSAMLLSYLRKSDTAGMLAGYLRRNFSNVTGTLPIANGGTARTSLPTSFVASNYSAWDASGNFNSNNYSFTRNSTTSSGGTVTMTATSSREQVSTGTAITNYLLPVTTTIGVGFGYVFRNESSQPQNIYSSGGNIVFVVDTGGVAVIQTKSTGATTAADWEAFYNPPATIAPLPNSLVRRDANGCTNMTSVTSGVNFTITLRPSQYLQSFVIVPNSGSPA